MLKQGHSVRTTPCKHAFVYMKYECLYSVMIVNSHRIIQTNKKTSTGYLGIIAIL